MKRFVTLIVLLGLAGALWAQGLDRDDADAVSIVGTYDCEGVAANQTNYSGTVEIMRRGDAYLVKWTVGTKKEVFHGLGVRDGDVLAVCYFGGHEGVVLYRIRRSGRMVGKWTGVPSDPKVLPVVFTETLTKR